MRRRLLLCALYVLSVGEVDMSCERDTTADIARHNRDLSYSGASSR